MWRGGGLGEEPEHPGDRVSTSDPSCHQPTWTNGQRSRLMTALIITHCCDPNAHSCWGPGTSQGVNTLQSQSAHKSELDLQGTAKMRPHTWP